MNELQYTREHFCGTYVSRTQSDSIMTYFNEDPGHPEEERLEIVRGLLKVTLAINSNYEFELTNNNGRKIRYHMNILHNGFWFTDFACQSMATFKSFNLTIEMMPKIPRARKVSYEFYQRDDRRKRITFKLYNGRKWLTIEYKKTDSEY